MSSRSEIAVRSAVTDDVPALLEIFAQSIADQAPPFYTALQVDAWSSGLTAERALSLITDHTTYVAEIPDAAPGQILGFATFAEPDEFDMLYVHPDHLMQGVGSRLATVVEQHARTLGVRELRATVSDCARIAFEAFGFRHEKPHTKTVGDQSFSVTLMSKSLG